MAINHKQSKLPSIEAGDELSQSLRCPKVTQGLGDHWHTQRVKESTKVLLNEGSSAQIPGLQNAGMNVGHTLPRSRPTGAMVIPLDDPALQPLGNDPRACPPSQWQQGHWSRSMVAL